MKKLLTICLMSLAALGARAQNESTATDKHLDFLGVEIKGSIDDIKEKLEPNFKLKKRVGTENYYLFEGPMFGYNVPVQVSYTRKSRTIFRFTVTPKNINLLAWQDSLINKYGDPVQTEQGLLWQRPEGMILYYAPQGYETALIYLDAAGNAAYKEEK